MALSVICDGLRLHARAVVPENPRALVVLLHGIPSVSPPAPDDTGYPGFAAHMADRGWAAAWGDMRGVRGSPGYFSIEGWVRDARALLDAARSIEGVGGLPVGIVASSAGGAVAVELAARGAPVAALVLLAVPASWSMIESDPTEGVRRITELAGMEVAPEVHDDPSAWAAEFEAVSPERSITSIRAPILIVHGTDDVVVPVDHADRLAARAQRAEVKIIERAEHQLRRDPRALEVVEDFLQRVLG